MKLQIVCSSLLVIFSGIASAAEPFRIAENNDKKQLSILDGTLPVLTYQYDVIEHEHIPISNPQRTAGCYVHPLYGINGEILTDNAPADHFHHHGVFWTWPHVGIHEPDGNVTKYDLWASTTPLKQHFVRWIGKTATEQAATFEVENGWFIGGPAEGKKIMTERVKVIVHRIQKGADIPTSRAVDFEFLWQPTDKPISLRGAEEKSYGGFTVRFKPFVREGRRDAVPNEINRITVPSGITSEDLPEMPLPWADYTSNFYRNGLGVAFPDGGVQAGAILNLPLKDQPSGATIFIPKTHPDFPPTWLTRHYGPLCVGWPGVVGKKFQPGEKIELRYRMWIHEGAVTVPQIEKAYKEYNE